MAGLNNTGKNIMLDALAAAADFFSLHTADPGTGGTSETTGGSPAYARKASGWGAASAASVVSTSVTFDAPAGTYTHIGYWSASTSGTFYGSRALAASITLGAQGQVTVSTTTESLT